MSEDKQRGLILQPKPKDASTAAAQTTFISKCFTAYQGQVDEVELESSGVVAQKFFEDGGNWDGWPNFVSENYDFLIVDGQHHDVEDLNDEEAQVVLNKGNSGVLEAFLQEDADYEATLVGLVDEMGELTFHEVLEHDIANPGKFRRTSYLIFSTEAV